MKAIVGNVYTKEFIFSLPNKHMVVELSKHYNCLVNENEASNLLSTYEYNIYKIINYFKGGAEAMELNAIDHAIIFIMYIWEYDIKNEKIIKLITKDSNVISCKKDISLSISKLKEYGIIREMTKDTISLYRECPIVQAMISSKPDLIYYEDFIIKQISNDSKTSIEELEIGYRISKELQLPIEKWLENIVLYKMRYGLPIDKELVKFIAYNKKLQIIVYTYLRDYQVAKNSIQEMMNTQMLSNDFEKLYAVLLNRCRKHKKAEKKLIECIAKEPDNYILKAYLVSNYIHRENLDRARELYYENIIQQDSIDKAYFYRNCGAAFWDNLEPFNKALEIFEKENELFGFYTTKCNLITRKLMLNCTDFEITEYKNMESNLAVYGYNNMHIFYNDWGIAELLNNNSDFALKLFNTSDTYAHSAMPHVFISINKACLFVKNKKYKEAKNAIDLLEQEVKQLKINRVKQKFYINKALVYYANNELTEKILQKCLEYPDRYIPKYTSERVNFFQECLKTNKPYEEADWNYCYCPCYLEYWYINPLKLMTSRVVDEVLSV